MQLRLKLALHTAESVVVCADIAQHLRGQAAVGVEALELLLQVDALQVQLAHPLRGIGVQLAGHPGKVARPVETRLDLVLRGEMIGRIHVNNLRQQGRVTRLVIAQLAGDRVHAVHQHGHGQLMQVAVVEHAAPRSHLKGAQLLLLRALLIILVAHHLQPHQTHGDDRNPRAEEQRNINKPHPADGCGECLSLGLLHDLQSCPLVPREL